jgi:hypothetical protein
VTMPGVGDGVGGGCGGGGGGTFSILLDWGSETQGRVRTERLLCTRLLHSCSVLLISQKADKIIIFTLQANRD